MNRLEFEELELQVQQSGLPLKSYLQQIGVSYSTYHYWRRKCSVDRNSVKQELAPISLKQSVMESSPEGQVPHGVAVLFPNGLRAHFGNGSEEILMELFTQSLRGRKNYLFCGNHEAAANMSVICSLLATCKAHDVNPRDYLNDVIARMPYHKKATHEELLELLPHKWKLQHPESALTKQEEEAGNRC